MDSCIGTTLRTQVMLLFLSVVLSFMFSFCNCTNPNYLYHICSNTTLYTSNSTYQSNLNTSSNTIYGHYFCRGDLTVDVCSDCINFAAQDIAQCCPDKKIGYIWYDESFFFTWNTQNVSDIAWFNQILGGFMNRVATSAASNSKRFATQKANVTKFQELYFLAQCSPDL
ncbi:hypothetical protein NE237_019667 [Protea cynaroides]|uniref:Gnk2-homologous domain-containing protein n=1 Tax=Protea cynaroides TaxID=273540 RepID=A0A9Q0H955_9MAGN|nr:hypothetical protein NE237_019667 [Protea cynaroides]